jgi:hypothetical protein
LKLKKCARPETRAVLPETSNNNNLARPTGANRATGAQRFSPALSNLAEPSAGFFAAAQIKQTSHSR